MRLHFKAFLTILFPAALLLVLSCEREKEDPVFDAQYLVDAELIAEYSAGEVVEMAGSLGLSTPGIEFLIKYDVSVYRIVYETTDTRNNPVEASGALVVPVTPDPLPLMSFQHGTITRDEDAPSYFQSEQYLATLFYSSAGYIISLPDYLGYGASRHLEHPYEHGKSLATASRDMLRAVREFDMAVNEFSASEKLFLTGYSQGGYATMALLKLLEQENESGLTVTAATAGAGAYNKTLFAEYILGLNRELTYINYFIWVLDTYNRVYDIDRPYSYYFNQPHASVIEEEGIFANTEHNPRKLFTGQFADGVLSGTDTAIMEALADNDNYDWKPSTPLRLYHGTDDDFVFYFNSLTAYDAMTARGAAGVELVTVKDGDHGTTVPEYFLGTFLFFAGF
ncbi:MAG: alpha/beta fold hydrolase [Marinilabiliales bacterium]|nr:MAG: alpha/beta fold hydrolase [Marinilabiliales bacterium]